MVSQGMVGQTNARRAAGVILQIIREGKIAGERAAPPLKFEAMPSSCRTRTERLMGHSSCGAEWGGEGEGTGGIL